MNKQLVEHAKVAAFVLDDDEDTLEVIKADFDKAGIKDYQLFTSEKHFLDEFHNNVHVAVIDHFIGGGMQIGYDIMQTIFEINEKNNSPIKCKVIIISGQRDQKVTKWYLNNGAFKYLDKDEEGFHENLVQYVKLAIEQSEEALRGFNGLLSLKTLFNER